MFGRGIIDAFIDDPTVRLIAVLVVLDLVLGIAAAVKLGTFRLSYIADVFRNDVMGKVFPYYALWAALHVSGIDWSISGLDVIEESTGALVWGALLGSVINSLRDLGIPGVTDAPDEVAGPDPSSPTPVNTT
jgi:uncharacterized YccA/Bax inhibitor family protein